MSTSAVDASRHLPAATVAQAQPQATTRLFYVDNIRVLLTILVILFHLMITYAGSGDWFYREPREDFITGALGAWFIVVNQAFFMGLFLLISAYFVPGSYDRKGPVRFLKDRLIRLGIPLALYSWIIRPLLVYAYLVQFRELRMSLWSFYTRQYFIDSAILGDGPLWFIETLLIFSALYALWRLLPRARPTAPVVERPFPGNRAIALFALLLGLAGFAVRLVWHVGYNYSPLNLQPPFFAQYIALFVVGLVAYRHNWLQTLPDRAGRLWLRIGILLILLFWPMALLGGMTESTEPFMGGLRWQALAYALWESFVCVSLCIGLIYLFRRVANRQGRWAASLSRNAYTAYLIHGVVIVSLGVSLQNVMLYPLLKWFLVSLIAVPLCFGLSSLIRKLPYTDRVL